MLVSRDLTGETDWTGHFYPDRTDPELGLVGLSPNFIGPNIFDPVLVQGFLP